jgi:hypothetical protein
MLARLTWGRSTRSDAIGKIANIAKDRWGANAVSMSISILAMFGNFGVFANGWYQGKTVVTEGQRR